MPNMKYCPNCGQENHSPRMPFFHYLYELMEGIFHLDGKTWRTIRALFFQPGRITKEFIEDKRSRYSPPVRMFIWSTAFYMFSIWFAADTYYHFSETASEAKKSMSQQFDEMPDSSSTSIFVITSLQWPTLPLTPVSKLRALKTIPENEIKGWLQNQYFPSDFFHVQLVKAYRAQINSRLSQSAFTKKMTTGNNILYVLLLPLEAFLLFLIFYRRKLFYYDTMIFVMHVNTWHSLFNSIWIWVLMLLIYFLDAPLTVFLSIPVFGAVYFFFAIKRAFGLTWLSTTLRWLPAYIIQTFYHYILSLLFAAWLMN